jgi:hypothetical protein
VANGSTLELLTARGGAFGGRVDGDGGGVVLWRAGELTSSVLPFARFAVTNGLCWRGGRLVGTITNAGLVRLDGEDDVRVQGGSVINAGEIRHQGPGALLLSAPTYGGVGVTNLPGALVDLQADGIAVTGSVDQGSLVFVNRGTVRKSAGEGTARVLLARHPNNTGAPRWNFVNSSGTVEALAGTLDIGEVYLDQAGMIRLDGGSLVLPGYHTTNGLLTGTGTLTLAGGAFTNSGTVAPGFGPGSLRLDGSYTQTPAGKLSVDLGGPSPDGDFDRFVVTGTAALNGALAVSATNGYLPLPGVRLRVLEAAEVRGVFASSNLPPAGPGLWWRIAYVADGVELRAASADDTDGDSLPDAWEQTHFGGLAASDGGADDFDGDGVADAEELASGFDPADPDEGPATASITGLVSYAGAAAGPVLVEVHGPRTNLALNLDGGGGRVELPPAAWFGSNFTVEAWIFVRRTGYRSRLIDFGNGAGEDNVVIAFDGGDNGRLAVDVYQDATASEIVAPEPMPLNRWCHLAVVRDDGGARVYLDGVPWFGGSLLAPRGVVVTNNFVGRSNFPGDHPADAMVDELRIWDHARAATQLVAGMRARLSGREAGLVGYWPFDRGAHDLGPARAHGRLAGGADSAPGPFEPVKRVVALAAPGPFAVTGLPVPCVYELSAFRDADGDGDRGPAEPWGAWTNNPVALTGGLTAVELTLQDDVDSDGDGLADREERGGGHYQLIGFTGTWAAARADAEARGGRLATITSIDEWLDLWRGLGTNLVGRDAWIGATDEGGDGDFCWITGERWSYARWDSGQPDGYGQADGVCLAASSGGLVTWADADLLATRSGYLLETGWYSDCAVADTDGDGLVDGEETLTYGSSPVLPDSDGDGLPDGEEVLRWGTQPVARDSDGDGQEDGFEVSFATAPTSAASFCATVSGAILNASGLTGPVQVTVTRSGFTNRFLSLDGVDDAVVVADDPALHLATGATVECWIRGGADQPEDRLVFVDKSAGYVDSSGWALQGVRDSGAIEWLGGGSDAYTRVTSAPGVLDGGWHHLAGTFDGRELALYVDGVRQGAAALTNALPSNAREVEIGHSWGAGTPNYHFRGSIDEVRLWNRALSPGEILDRMRRPVDGTEPGLAAAWNFDAGDFHDAGPGGFDGQPAGGAATAAGVVETLRGFTVALPEPGPYAVTNLPQPYAYAFHAWLDANTNGVLDVDEPEGWHLIDPLAVTGDMAGVDIPLGNADSDGDGLTDNAERTVTFTDPLRADTDGDLMPDGWEWTFGLSPTSAADGLADADGDGARNAEEYVADTNPTNAASQFRLALYRAGETSMVQFVSSSNRLYTIEAATNGASGSWSASPDFTDQPGAGGVQTIASPSTGAVEALRLKVRVP